MIAPNYDPAKIETTGNTPVVEVSCPVPTSDEIAFGKVLGPKRFAARPTDLFVNQDKIIASAKSFADSHGWGYDELLAKAAEKARADLPLAAGRTMSCEDVERILIEDDAFFGF